MSTSHLSASPSPKQASSYSIYTLKTAEHGGNTKQSLPQQPTALPYIDPRNPHDNFLTAHAVQLERSEESIRSATSISQNVVGTRANPRCSTRIPLCRRSSPAGRSLRDRGVVFATWEQRTKRAAVMTPKLNHTGKNVLQEL